MDIIIFKRLSLLLFLLSFNSVLRAEDSDWVWGGDLRLRGQVENQDAADSRKSARLRGRFGVKIKIEDGLSAELRLATLPSHRSSNQVLGDEKDAGMSRRYIGLDLAYADWKALPLLRMQAGRIPQWHQRPGGSQILLDDDIALEGVSLRSELSLSNDWTLYAGAGSALIRENYDSLVYSEDQTDNVLHSVDLALIHKGESSQLRIGVGFFNFVGLQNQIFADLVSGGAPLGNSEEPPGSGVVKNNFKPLRFFADAQFQWGEAELTPFVERLVNFETTDANRAWWLGVGYKQRAWSTQLAYAELESDVVPAVFTNSDFAAGQTDARGLVFSLQYTLAKNVSLKWTQFANRQRFSTDDVQHLRSHLDLSASF